MHAIQNLALKDLYFMMGMLLIKRFYDGHVIDEKVLVKMWFDRMMFKFLFLFSLYIEFTVKQSCSH